MKKLIYLLSIVVLIHNTYAQDEEVLLYSTMIPGARQYDPDDFTNNFAIFVDPTTLDRTPYDPNSANAQNSSEKDPNLLGSYLGGTIFFPLSYHSTVVKSAGQYTRNSAAPSARNVGGWLRDLTWETNSTATAGDASYVRGLGYPSVVTYLRHDMNGRFYQYGNGGATAPTTTWKIIGEGSDDTGDYKGSLTGKATDRANVRQRTADAAILMAHQQGRYDRIVGSLSVKGGTYIGTGGFNGIYADQASNFDFANATVIGGSELEAGALLNSSSKFAASASFFENVQRITLSDSTFQAGNLQGGQNNWNNAGIAYRSLDFGGGDGLTAYAADTGFGKPETVISITGGNFAGSQIQGGKRSVNFDVFDMGYNTLDTSGGDGAVLDDVGAITIHDATFIGGAASEAVLGGRNSELLTHGGNGLVSEFSGVTKIYDSTFIAGQTASAQINKQGIWDVGNLRQLPASAKYSAAIASGGSGILLRSNGDTTLENVTATGSAGSFASVSDSNTTATATGGHGVFAVSTRVTINGGTYTGSRGGTATATYADASGGAGVYSVNSALTINGGTFSGGNAGTANRLTGWGNAGVWVENSTLTITETATNTLINGDVFINGSTAVKILAGEITGDIFSFGSGTTAMEVSTNATYSGNFNQYAGTINVKLNNSEEGKFFSNVLIKDGSLKLNNSKVITEEGSTFVLSESTSALTFEKGLELGKGSSISTGYGTVSAGSGANPGGLVMGENSSIALNFDLLNGLNGMLNVRGDLIATNNNARIIANGTAHIQSDTNHIATIINGGVVLASNSLESVIQADFGWLTKGTIHTNSIAGFTDGINASHTYSSLTNTSLKDLDPVLLDALDTLLSDVNNTDAFFAANSLGEGNGTQSFRYNLSQLPDVADSMFQNQQQVAEQIAARGNEFRSMNGYASIKPAFGKKSSPTGAAGPSEGQEQSMQGWVRAYGGIADRDKQGNFASYEAGTWGSVIGVDKSFGNLLIGLAGGYAHTDLDAGSTYDTDVDTVHGSVYSTIGGESSFVDLSLTYGHGKTDEKDGGASDSSFDSDVFSGYIGGGITFDVKEKVAITPEASLLVSYYDQGAFTRGFLGKTLDIDTYEEWSYLSSLGLNLASVHQIDWMNRGLALIPEVRAHWIHEFNDELDDGRFTFEGASYPLFIRPREEDLLRFGVGFDVWNWKYQNTKFEVDYDGLFSSGYSAHIFSGKITHRF